MVYSTLCCCFFHSRKPKKNFQLKLILNIFLLVIVYINPNGDCGKYIKTNKFHSSHTKFGPGLPCNVYKSIIQSFVDCANNKYEVFKLIPEGNSNDFVRLKTANYNEKKRLIGVDKPYEMWRHIKQFCKLILADDAQLFSKNPFTNIARNKNITSLQQSNQTNGNATSTAAASNSTQINLPLTPQATSESSSSASSSSSTSSVSSAENTNNLNHENMNGHAANVAQKRKSTNQNGDNEDNAENEHSTKLCKLDSQLSSIPSKFSF